MSQQSVLKLLENQQKPLSVKEITIKLTINSTTVGANLRRLLEQNSIKVIYKGNFKVAYYFV